MKTRLSDKGIEAFRISQDVERAEMWDTVMPDLYLRVTRQGRKTWMVRRHDNGRRLRVSIGSWPAMQVAVARDTARKLIMESVSQLPTDVTSITFGVVCDQFTEKALPQLARTTRREWGRILRREITPVLGEISPSDAKTFRAALRKKLDGVDSVFSRNKILTVCSRVFNWGVGRDLLAPAPVFAGIEKLAEKPRERLLTDDEVRLILDAAAIEPVEWRAYWTLLFYTGMRRGTILSAEWEWVDSKERAMLVPSEALKGRPGMVRATAVPLVDVVIGALELQREATGHSRYILANPRTGAVRTQPQKAANRVRDLSGVEAWHVHDVRHYVSTTLARLGVEPHVIEHIMHHKSGSGIHRIYNQWAYVKEKRAALERLETHLLTLTSSDDKFGQTPHTRRYQDGSSRRSP